MVNKFWGMAVVLLLSPFSISPVYSQDLKEIYVSEAGNVLGTMFYFNPGYPSYAYVNGAGVLVWINMEIPGAMLEIDTSGNVKLVERVSPGTINYSYGRISQIGDVSFEYDVGRIRKIGNLQFMYDRWRLGLIGNVPIVIEDGFLRRLGEVRFEYESGRLKKIDDLLFSYETGRVVRIGEVKFLYDYGTLKRLTGEIPGVLLKITSVAEFRRSIK